MAAERGVSSVLGVVMILGITLAAITSMLMIGAFALETTQQDTELSQMETSMAQMSSKASLVALGDAGNQQFNLGSMRNGDLEIREDAGNVTIEYVNGTDIPDEDNLTQIYHTDQFGALVYTNGDREVAYQGGGVWKRTGQDGGEMISPPEYHYQSETLTFPIIRVAGEGLTSTGGSGEIAHEGSDSYYPNETMSNPLNNATVFVEIESDYHRGWYQFFDSRTDGEIKHDAENQTIRAELTALYQEQITTAIAVRNTIHDTGGVDSEDFEEGVYYPSASDAIDERIGNCDSKEPLTNDLVGGETYCANESATITEDYNFDASDGDIEVVFKNGVDFDIGGNEVMEIEGEHEVRFYIQDSVQLSNEELNTGGNASQFAMYVHSDVDKIEDIGNLEMTGIIYAPNTEVHLQGSPNFKGSIIAESFHQTGGAGVNVTQDPDLEDYDLGFEHLSDELRYLHITENTVIIDLD